MAKRLYSSSQSAVEKRANYINEHIGPHNAIFCDALGGIRTWYMCAENQGILLLDDVPN